MSINWTFFNNIYICSKQKERKERKNERKERKKERKEGKEEQCRFFDHYWMVDHRWSMRVSRMDINKISVSLVLSMLLICNECLFNSSWQQSTCKRPSTEGRQKKKKKKSKRRRVVTGSFLKKKVNNCYVRYGSEI